MRALPFVLILLGATALAGSAADWRGEFYRPRASRDPNVLTQVLPSGGGATSVADLCDPFASMMQGPNSFCLRPDGGVVTTAADGTPATTLRPAGSPPTSTVPLCPNGADCYGTASQLLNGGSHYYAADAGAAPLGDLSCWVLYRPSFDNGAFNALLTKDDGTNRAFSIFTTALSTATTSNTSFNVYNGDGGSVSAITGTGANQLGVWNMAAFTYDWVANWTSALTAYHNGASVGTPITAGIGPIRPTETTPIIVGADFRAASVRYFFGSIGGAGCTERVLTPAEITDLYARSSGTVTGARGEALTFTRATPATCATADGGITVLKSGVPCVVAGGIKVRPAIAPLNVYGERAIISSQWQEAHSTGSAATTTGETTDLLAPNGTYAATLVTFPDVSGIGTGYNFIHRATDLTAVPHTASIYLAGSQDGGTQGTTNFCLEPAAGSGSGFCTPVTLTPQWQRVTLVNKTPTVATWYPIIGVDGRDNVSAQTATKVYAWGLNVNAAAYLQDYCGPALSTALTCNAETVAYTSKVTAARGGGELRVTPTVQASELLTARDVWVPNASCKLTWTAAKKWSFVCGGRTALSAAQTFAAGEVQTVAWGWETSSGGDVCVCVNGTKTCAGGTPSAPTIDATTTVGPAIEGSLSWDEFATAGGCR